MKHETNTYSRWLASELGARATPPAFVAQLRRGLAASGPYLIELVFQGP